MEKENEKRFIAYFDILGFKKIVNRNSLEKVVELFKNLVRDSQSSICNNHYKQKDSNTIVPDMEYQQVKCLHISDSIIFWTESDDDKDLKNIIEKCFSFYRVITTSSVPIRGCICYGDFKPFFNEQQSAFSVSSIIGKGLVDAYTKAESLEFCGCVVDTSIIEKVKKDDPSEKLTHQLMYENKICYYNTPSKTGNNYEMVIRPIDSSDFNEVFLGNKIHDIKLAFTKYQKEKIEDMDESVKLKMNNTIDFFAYFRKNVYAEVSIKNDDNEE